MKNSTNFVSTGDLLASAVVFIIALPLSLGIAMASGAPMASAIVAIVVGGIIVGMIAGAPLVVTGPAAGLSALVLQLISTHGFQNVLVITALAGLLQILLALLRLGKVIEFIPKAVLEGVLSAIGLVIVLGQLHVLAGQKVPGGALLCILKLPESYITALSTLSSPSFNALLIGCISIAIQILWKKYIPKPMSIIPPALPAVLIATVLALNLELPRVVLEEIGSYVKDNWVSFSESIVAMNWLYLIVRAIGLAFVASAESLLTAKAIQVLASKKKIDSKLLLNRELLAQGFGNMLSASFGGLPLTGVMVRSAANIDSGATTRASTILHAVWVIAFVLFLPWLVALLPSAALAAILILTGIKLINFQTMLHELKSNVRQGYMWPVTAIAIMSTDLLTGLIIGLVVAALDYCYGRLAAKNK